MQQIGSSLLAAAACLVVNVLFSGAYAATFANGDFESCCSFATSSGGSTNHLIPNGWTANDAFIDHSSFNLANNAPNNVHMGAWALQIGNNESQLTPQLKAFSDVAGQMYTVQFYAAYGGCVSVPCGDPNAFLTVAVGASGKTLGPVVGSAYALYSFAFTGTGSDTIAISGKTNPSEWFVDDITISGLPVSEVPLPGHYHSSPLASTH